MLLFGSYAQLSIPLPAVDELGMDIAFLPACVYSRALSLSLFSDEAEQELVRRELQENANQSAVARAAGDK